ncbi:MAG: hypothetical protein HYW26_04850 [Candidatus Aenigmarchaeota archaeon]|nr:hypothetical protein [Candidatus Aenigmarchaeota archaeon]
MDFEFGDLSGLRGRRVSGFVRFSYLTGPSAECQHNYIFSFQDRIPEADEQPRLYSGADVEDIEPNNVLLTYKDAPNERIVLATIEIDDRCRDESPDSVSQMELFRMDVDR